MDFFISRDIEKRLHYSTNNRRRGSMGHGGESGGAFYPLPPPLGGDADKHANLPLFRSSLINLRRQSKAALQEISKHEQDDPLSMERSKAVADVTKLAFQLHQQALHLPPSMAIYLKQATSIERTLEEDLLSITLWPKIKLKMQDIHSRASVDVKLVANQHKAQVRKSFLCGLPPARLIRNLSGGVKEEQKDSAYDDDIPATVPSFMRSNSDPTNNVDNRNNKQHDDDDDEEEDEKQQKERTEAEEEEVDRKTMPMMMGPERSASCPRIAPPASASSSLASSRSPSVIPSPGPPAAAGPRGSPAPAAAAKTTTAAAASSSSSASTLTPLSYITSGIVEPLPPALLYKSNLYEFQATLMQCNKALADMEATVIKRERVRTEAYIIKFESEYADHTSAMKQVINRLRKLAIAVAFEPHSLHTQVLEHVLMMLLSLSSSSSPSSEEDASSSSEEDEEEDGYDYGVGLGAFEKSGGSASSTSSSSVSSSFKPLKMYIQKHLDVLSKELGDPFAIKLTPTSSSSPTASSSSSNARDKRTARRGPSGCSADTCSLQVLRRLLCNTDLRITSPRGVAAVVAAAAAANGNSHNSPPKGGGAAAAITPPLLSSRSPVKGLSVSPKAVIRPIKPLIEEWQSTHQMLKKTKGTRRSESVNSQLNAMSLSLPAATRAKTVGDAVAGVSPVATVAAAGGTRAIIRPIKLSDFEFPSKTKAYP